MYLLKVGFPLFFCERQILVADDYYAPFDFAISKTSIRGQKEEQSELVKQTKPYYVFNEEIALIKETHFKTEIDSFIRRVTGLDKFKYIQNSQDRNTLFGRSNWFRKEIYSKGIIQANLNSDNTSGY